MSNTRFIKKDKLSQTNRSIRKDLNVMTIGSEFARKSTSARSKLPPISIEKKGRGWCRIKDLF